MSILDILYTLLIKPLQLLFEVLYMLTNVMINDPGLSIVALSLMMNFLVLPLYMRADAMQEHERDMEAKLHAGVTHIKKTFKGDEKVMMLQTYYRQNGYKPTDVFKGSISLFLEIPFFISAYLFLSNLEIIKGVSFWFIPDLGSPDALISIAGLSINVLPFVMTGINLISCVIFTHGMPTKTKVQLYGMAIFFLIFLYASPAGLVFYWTLNNLFALIKTIFYKLKNPKKVLTILFAIVGVVAIVYGLLFFDNSGSTKRTLLVVGIGIVCLIPTIVAFVKPHVHTNRKPHAPEPNKKVFIAGALFLAVLLGLVIPSTIISASPQEFVEVSYFVHPDWYIASSGLLAAGMFLVWFGVFYWLCNPKAKVIFEVIVWLACGVAVLNYMAFGTDLGNLSSVLQYDAGMEFSTREVLVNAICIVALCMAMAFVFIKFKKVVPMVAAVASVALMVMTGLNINTINTLVDDMMPQVENYSSTQPTFTLSKTGQNVVVIMMDRAMGEYIPYIMDEKPELKESFSGFTYYANVTSLGCSTIFGSAALYGGYEYTPTEMNKRDTESLASKQNEALKVMPVLFDQNDYDVTVCDPTYANYSWTSDTSIYDEYPDINAYTTSGAFVGQEQIVNKISNNMRNFFCFSVTKVMPLFAQTTFYNDGVYNNSSAGTQANEEIWGTQVVSDNHLQASGLSSGFMTPYTVLDNLDTMTKISDDGASAFVMMSNDTTHNCAILQEGDYTPSVEVDNTEYEAGNSNRFTVDGQTLAMENATQAAAYQSNMASIIKLGEWLDYLKANDVYDNTRIIIVSDHGYPTFQLEDMEMNIYPTDLTDMETYYPLLLVKDFNATEFTTSEEFMTNADVPTIATQDVIENPVNLFTGKALNNDEKYAHDQLVFASHTWETTVNNGNTFLDDGLWFSVHDDMRDLSNWTLLDNKEAE